MNDVKVLPPPRPSVQDENAMWVDEQIWGHRLWDAQSPWLIFLEFLTIAESRHRDHALFTGDLLDDAESARVPWRPVGLSQAGMVACSARCR